MKYKVNSDLSERVNGFLTDSVFSPEINIMWLDIFCEGSDYVPYKEEHFHTFFEVHFVLAGELCYRCDGEEITAREGEAVFIPPEVPHSFVYTSEEYCRFSLGFAIRSKNSAVRFYDNAKSLKFSFPDKIVAALERIVENAGNEHFLVPALMKGEAANIIYSVFESLGIRLPKIPVKPRDHRFSLAVRYIKENISRPILCEEVAKECCVSAKQLNRIFKKEFGSNISEYIIAARVEFCQELLMKGMSIKEISLQMGFSGESGFAAFFKRHCGMTPGMFRKVYSGVRAEEL